MLRTGVYMSTALRAEEKISFLFSKVKNLESRDIQCAGPTAIYSFGGGALSERSPTLTLSQTHTHTERPTHRWEDIIQTLIHFYVFFHSTAKLEAVASLSHSGCWQSGNLAANSKSCIDVEREREREREREKRRRGREGGGERGERKGQWMGMEGIGALFPLVFLAQKCRQHGMCAGDGQEWRQDGNIRTKLPIIFI